MTTLTDNRAASRFEWPAAGATAILDYRREGDRIVLTHTEVPEALSGQGIGSKLVRAALDVLRDEGVRVVPVCEFVATWIERHPEYRDLVAEDA